MASQKKSTSHSPKTPAKDASARRSSGKPTVSPNQPTKSRPPRSSPSTQGQPEPAHQVLADRVETVSMAAGIASGVAAAAAAVAAPTGLTAAGVWLGLISAPLVVTAAPVIGTVAAATGFVSGGFYFYSKWRRRRSRTEAPNPSIERTS